MRARLLFAAVLASLSAVPQLAAASPWTLPRGDAVFYGGLSYQFATSEFLQGDELNGAAQVPLRERAFPLRGRYDGMSFNLGARFGITDDFELQLDLPVRLVAYASDPVILLPAPDGSDAMQAFDHYQTNIINLGRNAAGIADVYVGGRYRLLRDPFPLAIELKFKLPTGYAGPSGTFGDQPASIAAFAAEPGRYAAPGNVRDDVTLGDGQLDINPNLLFGYAFPTRTFVRVDAGYNLRLGDAADQVVGRFSAGQFLGDHVLVYASVGGALSVERGRVIGVSVAAVDPLLPASEYIGTSNLLLRAVRLERDYLDVGGGLIVKVTDTTEINFNYSRTLLGRNTSVVNSFGISFSIRTDLDGSLEAQVGLPPPAPVEEPVVVEEPLPEAPPTEPAPADAAPLPAAPPAAPVAAPAD